MVEKEKVTLVVEVCANCTEHNFSLRHDEAKYREFFNDFSD